MQRAREHRFEGMTKMIVALEEALSLPAIPPARPGIVRPRADPIAPASGGRPFYCPQCATRLDEECPITPDVVAISRDTLRVIAFGENIGLFAGEGSRATT
jgi:hypothetical protein